MLSHNYVLMIIIYIDRLFTYQIITANQTNRAFKAVYSQIPMLFFTSDTASHCIQFNSSLSINALVMLRKPDRFFTSCIDVGLKALTIIRISEVGSLKVYFWIAIRVNVVLRLKIYTSMMAH